MKTKKFILKEENFLTHKRIVADSGNVYLFLKGVPYIVKNDEDIKFFEKLPYVKEYKETKITEKKEKPKKSFFKRKSKKE